MARQAPPRATRRMAMRDMVADAERLCGCRACGGRGDHDCMVIELLPHIARAESDSLKHKQLRLESEGTETQLRWLETQQSAALALLGMFAAITVVGWVWILLF